MTDRMDAVDHTHPAQDAVTDAYRRGRTGLRADGSGEDPATDARMRDVSHTPADGEGTNDVWSRGTESADPADDE